MRNYTILVIVALLFAGVAGSATVARAGGGDTSLIHACVQGTGQVRLVGADEPCKNNESAVHWPATPTSSAGARFLAYVANVLVTPMTNLWMLS
jgi:hypothetical protein